MLKLAPVGHLVRSNQAIQLAPAGGASDRVSPQCKEDRRTMSDSIDETTRRIDDLSLRIASSPSDAGLYAERGQAYYELGDGLTAILDLDTSLELAPNNLEFLIARAVVHHDNGDVNLAMSDITEADSIDPLNSDVIYYRAMLNVDYDDLVSVHNAVGAIRAAIDLEPYSPEYHRGLAVCLIRDQEHAQALLAAQAATVYSSDPSYGILMVRGDAHAGLLNVEEALSDYRQAAAIDPSSPVPHTRQAALHIYVDQTSSALLCLDRAIAIAPTDTMLLGRASLHRDMGNPELCLADLDLYLEAVPGEVDAFLMMIEANLETGACDAAVEACQLIERRLGLAGRSRVELARVSVRMGQTDKAVDLLSEVIADRTMDSRIEALEERTRVHALIGDGHSTLVDYGELAILRPENDRLIEELINSLAAHGSHDAVERLTTFISMRGEEASTYAAADSAASLNDPRQLSNRGTDLMSAGEYGDALAEFDRALQLDPQHMDALLGRGLALTMLAKYVSAEEVYRAALLLAPRNARVRAGLGGLLLTSDPGRVQEARMHFYEAVDLEPGNAEFHRVLGEMEASVNHPALAFSHLNKSLALVGGQKALRTYLARADLKIMTLDPAGALDDAEAAIRLDGSIAAGHLYRAYTLRIMGRHSEALVSARESVTRDASTLDGWVELALAHLHLGELAEAEQAAESLPHGPAGAGRHERTMAEIRRRQGRHQAAATLYDRAVETARDNPEFLAGRAGLRWCMGDSPGAVSDIQLAVKLRPVDLALRHLAEQMGV